MIVLIIIFSALSFWIKGGDFFLGLVVEIIGIIIITFYVDYILKSHEEWRKKMLWKEAEKRINHYLETFIYDFVNYIRELFGHGIKEVLDFYTWDKDYGFFITVQQKFIKFSKEVLEKEASKKMNSLARKDWQEFIKKIEGSLDSASKIFTMFEDKLPPLKYTPLVDIQYYLNQIMNLYTTFSNVIGVPTKQIPPSVKISSKEIGIITSTIAGLLGSVLHKIGELNDIIYAEKLENRTSI